MKPIIYLLNSFNKINSIPYNFTISQFRSVSQFRALLELEVKEFTYIRVYQQIDGVNIGLPLETTLTNVFLRFHESNWLNG